MGTKFYDHEKFTRQIRMRLNWQKALNIVRRPAMMARRNEIILRIAMEHCQN